MSVLVVCLVGENLRESSPESKDGDGACSAEVTRDVRLVDEAYRRASSFLGADCMIVWSMNATTSNKAKNTCAPNTFFQFLVVVYGVLGHDSEFSPNKLESFGPIHKLLVVQRSEYRNRGRRMYRYDIVLCTERSL